MTETPRPPVDEDEIDEAAVLRAMDGDKSVPLNGDEVLEAIDRMHDRGETDTQIADRLGASDSSVHLWRTGKSQPLGLAANRTPKTPASPVAGERALTSVPALKTTAASAPPSVDALVSAAARSTSKRTQALGVKLHDLAGVLRQRLTDEREAAEAAERQTRERAAAAAEVARLEAALREAKAKVGGTKARSVRPTTSEPREQKPLSDAKRQQLDAMRAKNANTDPCANGCGYVATTKAGKKSHEHGSKCPGGAA